MLVVLLRRLLSGHPRSYLEIGGGHELSPDNSALLELADSIRYVADLDTLSTGTSPRLSQLRLPPCEVG